MKTKKIRAFTLVEVMMTVIIIAILWTLAFLYLQNYTYEARDSKRKDYLNKLKSSIETYYLENDKYPEVDNKKASSSQTWWIEGEIWQWVIYKLQKISLQKDPNKKTNYKYFVLVTWDAFKLETELEKTGEIYIVGNTEERQIYIDKNTWKIFKYAWERWKKEDNDCDIKDLEIYSSAWELKEILSSCKLKEWKICENWWEDASWTIINEVKTVVDSNFLGSCRKIKIN